VFELWSPIVDLQLPFVLSRTNNFVCLPQDALRRLWEKLGVDIKYVLLLLLPLFLHISFDSPFFRFVGRLHDAIVTDEHRAQALES
jgi:hypothetical protein